jgi:hypothetical protein
VRTLSQAPEIDFVTELKDVCTYTFQKLEGCPNTRHLESACDSSFPGNTEYKFALRRGVVFAIPFHNRQLAENSFRTFRLRGEPKGV